MIKNAIVTAIIVALITVVIVLWCYDPSEASGGNTYRVTYADQSTEDIQAKFAQSIGPSIRFKLYDGSEIFILTAIRVENVK
jgi:hypothetical protein